MTRTEARPPATRPVHAYYVASLLAYLAHAMVAFGVVTWAQDTTGSTGLSGLAVLTLLSPTLLLALGAGRLADRRDRSTMLVAAQVLLAMTSVAMGIIAGSETDGGWILLPVTTVYGIAMAFALPSRLALIADIADLSALRGITVTSSFLNTAALAAGPPAVGLLGATGGWGLVFAAVVAAWVASTWATVIARVPAPTARRQPSTAAKDSLVDFFRARRDVALIVLLSVSFIVLLVGPLQILVPAFAGAELGLDAAGRGALMGVVGGGIFAGGVLARVTIAATGTRTLLAATGAAMASPIALALCNGVAATSVVLVVIGATAGYVGSIIPSQLQAAADDTLRGRLMAVWVIVRWAMPAFGALLAGTLGAVAGLRPGLVALGALGLTSVALLGPMLLRETKASELPHSPLDRASLTVATRYDVNG